MGFQVTTAPTIEPVTRAEAKVWCKVDADITEDDGLIDTLITSARQWCEEYTHRAFVTQSITQTWDEFPKSADADGFYSIRPYRARLISVTSLKYINSSGTLTALVEDTDFKKDTYTEPGRLYPVYGTVWPTTRDEPNAVQLIATCGFGSTAATVPKAIQDAIKLLVANLYKFREAEISGTIIASVEFSLKALLAPFVMPNPEGY